MERDIQEARLDWCARKNYLAMKLCRLSSSSNQFHSEKDSRGNIQIIRYLSIQIFRRRITLKRIKNFSVSHRTECTTKTLAIVKIDNFFKPVIKTPMYY